VNDDKVRRNELEIMKVDLRRITDVLRIQVEQLLARQKRIEELMAEHDRKLAEMMAMFKQRG
jgi:hypothetical protein